MSDTTKNQITIYLLRHGETKGNSEKRYVGGRTDEPLTDVGRKMLTEAKQSGLMVSEHSPLYVSPMLRAMQTAEIMFPGKKQIVVEAFREIDFGDFENKNYEELNGNPDYQAWIDSGGTIPFPNGETNEAFGNRAIMALSEILKAVVTEEKELTVVAHGGTIMALMSHFTKENYFDFMVKNGEGYALNLEIDLESNINVVSYDRISCRVSS